jgi:ParB-like chromosome segregation protein Spo0J
MSEVVLLPIEVLRYTAKRRRGISPRRVEELRQAIELGDDVLPIRVNALGDGTYVVRDGRHRIQAHIEAGIGFIYALVDNLGTRFKCLMRFLFGADLTGRLFILTKQGVLIDTFENIC